MRPLTSRLLVLALLAGTALPGHALDVNDASQAQLERLRGIGVERSQRLLQERERRRFSGWADLKRRLPGWGDRQWRQLSEQGLRVDGMPCCEAPR